MDYVKNLLLQELIFDTRNAGSENVLAAKKFMKPKKKSNSGENNILQEIARTEKKTVKIVKTRNLSPFFGVPTFLVGQSKASWFIDTVRQWSFSSHDGRKGNVFKYSRA